MIISERRCDAISNFRVGVMTRERSSIELIAEFSWYWCWSGTTYGYYYVLYQLQELGGVSVGTI